MPYQAKSTMTSKGQVTIPAPIREQMGVKPGDQLRFEVGDSGRVTVSAIKRRSIFERLDELKLPSLGRPLARADIESAVTEAVHERYESGLRKRKG